MTNLLSFSLRSVRALVQRSTAVLACVVVAAAALVSLSANAQPSSQMSEQNVRGPVHLVQGSGGNIAVINGDRSMLVIDNGLTPDAERVYQSLMKVGNKPLRFLVNTHHHFDHAGGNEFLGPRTNIVAHNNVRNRLSKRQEMKAFDKVIEPYSKQGLPVVTYEQSTTLHEAGQRVHVQHFPNGHTDGDSIVFITPAKVVHMGDHYFFGQFPFVDLESGGSVQGMSHNIAKVLDLIDDSWVVIPGHGPLADRAQLAKTHAMLERSIAFITEEIAKGHTPADTLAAGLPEDLQTWAKGFIKPENWIATVYASLSAE